MKEVNKITVKSYKIRIYPTKEQEEKIWKNINASRFIYNYFLAWERENYESGNKYPGKFGFPLTELKKTQGYEWLYEVSNVNLKTSISDLDKAFQNFFKRVKKGQKPGYPKYKSRKHSKMSYPTRAYLVFTSNKVNLEKVGKVKYKTDLNIPLGKDNKFTDPRVSYHRATGKYFLSFGLEIENQNFEKNDYNVGIDLGIKELAVISYDNNFKFFHNINKSQRVKALVKKQKSLQRAISRKYEQNKQGNKFIKTKNIEKQELELLKVYNKLSNIRDNYIHQITSEIIKLAPKAVIMEDLNVTGMMKNRHLSKSIQEQCFNKFISYMKYKCEFNGIEFVQVDRFYPSSKMCCNCGSILKTLTLKDRIYKCPDCGKVIDRDLNAAINLENYLSGN